MKKTTEQMKAEFITLMSENGFAPNGETTHSGSPVYSRTWSKETEVVWYGTRESRLEIQVIEVSGKVGLWIMRNGRLEGRRDYSTPKRAINAVREIVTYAGFAF